MGHRDWRHGGQTLRRQVEERPAEVRADLAAVAARVVARYAQAAAGSNM
jgi:hypothetical protein